ncbi:MAG TPA: c-type cytochrome [Burkholderiaceae bacterium]|nr:c-type cytochrome [Burkholderiaceae bacterium]
MRVSNQRMRRVPAMLVAAAVITVSGACYAAEGDKVTANIAAGKQIFLNGKESVSPCQSCHGEKALGIDAMQTPKLANDGYAYIVKQLTDFAEDRRTDLTLGVMNLFAKQLSVEDRRNVAAYLNTLAPATEPSDLAALKAAGTEVGEVYKGLILVRYGVIGKAPACQSCHGFNGRGADPIYPQIGQQKYVYLVNQLKHWRDGSRANDPIGQMRAVAKNMTDEDIQNAAAFLSSAPQSTVGNGFVPQNESVLENITLVK